MNFTPVYTINSVNNTITIDKYTIKLDFIKKVFPYLNISIPTTCIALTETEIIMLIKEFEKSMTTEPTLAEMIHEKIESDALAGRTVPEILSARTLKDDEKTPMLTTYPITSNGVNIEMYAELVPISLIKEVYPNIKQTSFSVSLSKEQEIRVWETFIDLKNRMTKKWDAFKTAAQAERKLKQENVKQSVEDILAEREKTHGKYSNHAFVTQQIKRNMKDSVKWKDLSYTQEEALEMIAHKIGRILSGDPNERDHWVDIAGYATLVSKEMDTWEAIQAQGE